VVRSVAARTDGRMNLYLTDGRQFTATAWGDTLWLAEDDDGVRIASEPDDENESGWRELPDRTLLTVANGRVATSAIETTALKGIA
jgi:gamma-glutamyl hercynylcysteine S-oxide hydrolase